MMSTRSQNYACPQANQRQIPIKIVFKALGSRQSPQPSTLLDLFSIARARPRQNLDRIESDWIADRGSRIADGGSRMADRITVWITDWTTDWITHRKKEF